MAISRDDYFVNVDVFLPEALSPEVRHTLGLATVGDFSQKWRY